MHAAVPATIEQGPGTVGAARTNIQGPVSPYAGALEGIAGKPVAGDSTAKFGPALGALTGDAPAAGAGTGVVGAVTSAAATVVNTVKEVGIFEDVWGWPGVDMCVWGGGGGFGLHAA